MRGEFKATLDAKGRMNFPAKLRDELGSSFIIAKDISAECIKVYTLDDWNAFVAKVRELPQAKTAVLQRVLFGSAFEVEPDKNGRILIPQSLREYAALKSEIIIVGLEGRPEIWDKEAWDTMISAQDTESLLNIAEEFGL